MIKEKRTIFWNFLSNMLEALLILFLGFGLFIHSSTQKAISNEVVLNEVQNYNSYDFIFIVLFEIIMLSIILAILKYRKWRVADFNLDFNPSMIAIAGILVIIRFSLSNALIALNVFHPITSSETTILFQTNFTSRILMLIVNSAYEEFLLIGYLFKRFEKFNPFFIVLISFLVRASYHTYQGWENLPMVLSISIVFGIYYIKYKKLWPIIIAHGIGNLYFFLNEQL